MTHSDRRPDGSLTPINYLNAKTACSWAFRIATRDDLYQARRDLGLIDDDDLTIEHHAILESAHFARFGRFLGHA